ncbi:hypothetical protein [Actinomadura macrotermitis]|uniref:Integral membrane protein n=1 Tax=Actinomadura macrotermitis TaxID=2585200 RepID=A0A7K0BRS7_9ACTN|nr:hypothetical protein [Actinomadura macrotermitis]MQY03837.1 hypothetical protein [Actinomadura macrotermitis]
MHARSVMPRSVRTARVLLFVAAGLTAMAALDAGLELGGGYGAGIAIAALLPAAASAAGGLAAARRPSRPLWFAILALEVFYLFWQFGRIGAGDAMGLIGLIFPIVILVMVCRSSARRYFRTAGA